MFTLMEHDALLRLMRISTGFIPDSRRVAHWLQEWERSDNPRAIRARASGLSGHTARDMQEVAQAAKRTGGEALHARPPGIQLQHGEHRAGLPAAVDGVRTMKDRPHDEAMAEAYRKRPAEAVAMFRALLLDGGQLGEWRIFWRHVRLALR